MSKEFWATLGGQLAATLLQLSILGVVLLLIWRQIFGKKTATTVVENVIDSAASIPGGVVSLIGSAARGESEASYITFAEQQVRAAQLLALERGQGASL